MLNIENVKYSKIIGFVYKNLEKSSLGIKKIDKNTNFSQ